MTTFFAISFLIAILGMLIIGCAYALAVMGCVMAMAWGSLIDFGAEFCRKRGWLE